MDNPAALIPSIPVQPEPAVQPAASSLPKSPNRPGFTGGNPELTDQTLSTFHFLK